MPPKEDLYTRFSNCPPEALAWAEAEAHADLSARYESRTAMTAQAHTLLAVLMAGIGGSLTFAARLLEPAPPVTAWAAAALGLWFTLVAAVTVMRCLQTREVPARFNRPSNMLYAGYTFEQLRIAQIELMDERSRELTALNEELACWLNRCRVLALLSPAVLALAALLAHAYR